MIKITKNLKALSQKQLASSVCRTVVAGSAAYRGSTE